MKKLYLLMAVSAFMISALNSFAQPTVLYTDANTTVRTSLVDLGSFRQSRIQANAAGTKSWAFHTGTIASASYNPCWRPYTGGNVMSYNTFIPVSYANGAKYNTNGGGVDGVLNSVVSGNYYTFNVTELSGADNIMQVLQTAYNPTTAISNFQVPGATNVSPTIPVAVNIQTAAAPASNEYFYVRYTNNNWTSSAIVPFTFVLNNGSTQIPGQAAGTVVQYYIFSSNKTATQIAADVTTNGQVAYDMATLTLNNNGGSNFTYTVLSAATANPVEVKSSLGTTYGAYATVSAAFAAINAGTHQGTIVITVLGNTTEPANPVGLLKSASPSSYSSVNLVPYGGNWTLNSPASANMVNMRGIVEIVGADNFTINGDDPYTAGTQNLTFAAAQNSTVNYAALKLMAGKTDGSDGADNVTVTNCKFIGSSDQLNATKSTYGIVLASFAGTASLTNGAGKSTNTIISNNLITRCKTGIYAWGQTNSILLPGLQILNNIIGSATAAENIGLFGIDVGNTSTNGTGAALIKGNDIRIGEVSETSTGYSVNIAGINVDQNNVNIKIDGNNIHDVIQPFINGNGAYGILFSSGTGSTGAIVTNNFIRDIVGAKQPTNMTSIAANAGIFFSNPATGVVLNNNTIALLKLNVNGSTANSVSACVLFAAAGANFSQCFNNIFVNLNSSSKAFGILANALANISSSSMDNNDYWVPNGNVGYYGGNQTTLASWKTATTKDANSFNINPPFASVTNLHIPAGTATVLESGGAPTSTTGVSYDFDNENRPGPTGSVNGGGSKPDIGADEFDGKLPNAPIINSVSANPEAQCLATSHTITASVTSLKFNISSVKLYYSVNGGANTAVTMTGGTATGTSNWTATIPAATPANATVTYYVEAIAGAYTTTGTNQSYADQQFTAANLTTSATPNYVCSGTSAQLNVVVTGTGTYTYNWAPATNLDNATIANPTASNISANTTYTVTVSNGNCSATKNVVVNVNTATNNVDVVAATTGNLVEACTEGSWTYYKEASDNTNRFVFGIEWGATNSNAKSNAQPSIHVDATYTKVESTPDLAATYTMKRFWNVNLLNGATLADPVNVRFFYNISEKNEIEAAAQTFATANTGTLEQGQWFKTVGVQFDPAAIGAMDQHSVKNAIPLVDANASAQATINGKLYAQFNGITSFSGGTFATGVGLGTPTPIKLISFAGTQAKANLNNLTWKVACTDDRANKIELQRSNSQNGQFANIYVVQTSTANCNLPFSFGDANPLAGNNFYRLRMIDADGLVTFSNVVKLNNNANALKLVSVSPNPAQTSTVVNFSSTVAQNVTIKVVDAMGKTVVTQMTNANIGENKIKLNVKPLVNGVYQVSLIGAGKVLATSKLVKQ